MAREQKKKTDVQRTRKAAKMRAIEEEKVFNTIDIANPGEPMNINSENMKKVQQKIEQKKKEDREKEILERKK